jgi:hypothetical protein
MKPDEVEEITSYIKGEERAGTASRYSTPVGRRDYVFGLLASILILQLSFSFPSWSAVAISHREGLNVAI